MELSIDTSTRYAGVCLSQQGAVVAEYSWFSRQNHSVELLPAVERLLKEVDIAARDLACIVIAIGPGGFSALRVGMSSAKGLGIALDIPLVALNTLDVEADPYRRLQMPVYALLDMGRGEAAAALYGQDQGVWRKLEPGADSEPGGAVRWCAAADPLLRRGGIPLWPGPEGAPWRKGRVGGAVASHQTARRFGPNGVREVPAR